MVETKATWALATLISSTFEMVWLHYNASPLCIHVHANASSTTSFYAHASLYMV